jgi:hypothetical protein
MPILANQIVCRSCEEQVMQKVTASGVVGLPFFGVGALITASVGMAICEWHWEHKNELGHCARCGCARNSLSLVKASEEVLALPEDDTLASI